MTNGYHKRPDAKKKHSRKKRDKRKWSPLGRKLRVTAAGRGN